MFKILWYPQQMRVARFTSTYLFEHYSTLKIGVERVNQEKCLVEFEFGWQPTVRSFMLFGVINILFSCMLRLFSSETTVHHDGSR